MVFSKARSSLINFHFTESVWYWDVSKINGLLYDSMVYMKSQSSPWNAPKKRHRSHRNLQQFNYTVYIQRLLNNTATGAASWQNQQNGMGAQRRLRSAWACAQSDQSLRCCVQWVAKDPRFLHAISEDSDQTGRMPRLIWVFARRTCHFVGFVIRRLIVLLDLNWHLRRLQNSAMFYNHKMLNRTRDIWNC